MIKNDSNQIDRPNQYYACSLKCGDLIRPHYTHVLCCVAECLTACGVLYCRIYKLFSNVNIFVRTYVLRVVYSHCIPNSSLHINILYHAHVNSILTSILPKSIAVKNIIKENVSFNSSTFRDSTVNTFRESSGCF